jgi:hypothetical protein
MIEFPLRALRVGRNTLEIRSQLRRGDVDDFEFVDVRVVVEPSGPKVFDF